MLCGLSGTGIMSAFKDLTKTPGAGKRIHLAPVLQKILSKIKWKLSKDRKLKKQISQ